MKRHDGRGGIALLLSLLLALQLCLTPMAVLAEDTEETLNPEYTASGFTGPYDGQPHSISVNVSTQGVSVRYAYPAGTVYSATNPTFTVPGSYTVGFMIDGPGYTAVEDTATVTITEAEIDYEVGYLEVDYDGKTHAIDLTVKTEGVSSSFSMEENGTYSSTMPTFSKPGSYEVFFKLEKTYYKTETGSAELVIRAIDISSEVKAKLPTSFPCTGKPVNLNLPTDKIKEWSVNYCIGDDGVLDGPPSEPGEYTAYISGESELYRAFIVHRFTIVDALPEIEYSVGNYTGTYDGKPHTILLDVYTPGVKVTYARTANGSFTTPKPRFVNAGSYTVYYRLEKDGCETVEGSATVTINRTDMSDQLVFNKQDKYPYTGSPVDFAPSCEGINASEWRFTYYDANGSRLAAAPSDPGSYSVKLYGDGANCFAWVTHAYSIVKGKISYGVNDYSGYYDGEAHTIALNVLTEGVTVTYTTSEDGEYSADMPSFIDPGKYTVWFRLEKEDYETVVDFATVTILELRQIEYSVEDNYVYCDGEEHTIALNVLTEGVTVTYSTSEGGAYSADMPVFTDVGAYTVWFRLEKEGYETVTGSATVAIGEPSTILYTLTSYEGAYDGQPHTISLNVLTEDVTVTYFVSGVGSKMPPTFTEPGSYTVQFLLEKGGYVTKRDSGSVTIKPGVIEYSARGYSGYADGKAHSISLYVSTPDAKVSYATSEDGEYSAEKPSFSKVGTHTVWYRIEKEHYETVEGSEVVKLLQQKEDSIVYSVEDYVGAYDGEAHTIALDVTTPDVKASYATSEKGAYGATLPTFTEPGTYTVWCRLEKSGYETSTGSATVTIEKAEQILYFKQTVRPVDPSENSTTTFLYWSGLIHERGDGALSWSCSDPSRIHLTKGDIRTGTLRFDVPYEEWSKGYSATITATAAETDHYKAATATCKYVGSSSIQGSYSVKWFYNQSGAAADVGSNLDVDKKPQNQETLLSTNLDLTILPVTHLDDERLSSVSDELRRKLMASAGSDQIGAMAVDAALTDNQTGEERHSTNGDLTLSLTGDLQQSYQENYKNMSCIAVHIKQDVSYNPTLDVGQDSSAPAELDVSYDRDTTSAPTGDSTVQSYDFTMPTDGVTVHSSFAPMPNSTPAPQGTSMGGAGASAGSSGFTMSGGTIDTSGANPDGSGVYAGSSGFTMTGGTIDTAGANADGSGVNSDSSGIILIGGSVSMMTTNASDSTPAPQDTTAPDTTAPDTTAAPLAKAGPDWTAVSANEVSGITTNGSLKIGGGLNGTGSSSKGGVLDFTVSANEVNKELLGTDNSNEEQLLVSALGDLTLVPTGSLSPTVEYIPCKLTENGVIVSDTSLSPFLLIYGPKEAFSKLLTVRAKDGVFTWDGEGHAVAAEPSIAEGTALYYSLDLENWQTEAPSFTDVLWNEDGSVGSYQVYVLADNPDCDPAVCSYTVTILPAQ